MCEADWDFTDDYEWTMDAPYGLRLEDLEAFSKFCKETGYGTTKRTKTCKNEKRKKTKERS